MLGLLSVGVFLVVVGAAFFSGRDVLGALLVAIMLAVVAFNVYNYAKQL